MCGILGRYTLASQRKTTRPQKIPHGHTHILHLRNYIDIVRNFAHYSYHPPLGVLGHFALSFLQIPTSSLISWRTHGRSTETNINLINLISYGWLGIFGVYQTLSYIKHTSEKLTSEFASSADTTHRPICPYTPCGLAMSYFVWYYCTAPSHLVRIGQSLRM